MQGPAALLGLIQPLDQIISVNGEHIFSLDTHAVQSLMTGPPMTRVILGISHEPEVLVMFALS